MKNKNDLAWLINPYTKSDFIGKFLENKPLIISRNDSNYYNELMSFEELDFITSNMSSLGSFDLRMASAEKVIFEKQYSNVSKIQNVEVKVKSNPRKVSELFHKHGATIILEQVSNVWPSILSLSNFVNQELMCSSGANIYISPPNSQGFEAHYDTHDVFIIQVHGSKRWKIYDNPIFLPLGTQPSVPYDSTDIVPAYDFILEQGDLIYIPKGFVHEAMTSNDISAHITLGIYNTTWARIILDCVSKLAVNSEILRSGFFVDDLKSSVSLDDKISLIQNEIINAINIENVKQVSTKYKPIKEEVSILNQVLSSKV
ncbi:hypothetical protein SanaruYs_34880 [Chryseotalea sanaruensis]|uniref:JmjC domain-containing protein n=1 Tax=Chryseotalea sanaruensis TaxID=2482724 RepID=A0A401UEA9_9BACT|nr:cupin domain-containing protein [Chryseotalea sanaruensis]GCC53245.1 hypothetical protein SanaruYs_34880 [Chryseotalea sanaruensis]